MKKKFLYTYKYVYYILYLRRFEPEIPGEDADDYVDKQLEKLADNLRMKLLSIGNPMKIESMLDPGGEHYFTSGDKWKAFVKKLEENAQIIFIRLDYSDGLIWELSNIEKRLYKKILISIPDCQTYNQYFINNRSTLDIIPKGISIFPAIVYFQDEGWVYKSDGNNEFDSLDSYLEVHCFEDDKRYAFAKILESYPNSIYYRDGHSYGGLFFSLEVVPLSVPFIERLLFFFFPFLYIHNYGGILCYNVSSILRLMIRVLYISIVSVCAILTPVAIVSFPLMEKILFLIFLIYSGFLSAKNGVHFFNLVNSHLKPNALMMKVCGRSVLYVILVAIYFLCMYK